ncbi:DUF973 family protein [Acidianus manzaensis]|nr:DUF973 family protein [Acidianus manzaensis]
MLFPIISVAVILISIPAFSLSTISTSSGNSTALSNTLASATTVLIIASVLFILSPIFQILGVISMRKGFSILRNLGRPVGTGETGATLYLVSLLLLVISLIIIVITSISLISTSSYSDASAGVFLGLFAGTGLAVVAAILGFIGIIMISIGTYQVGDTYRKGIVEVGGILVLVGFLLSFASFLTLALSIISFILIIIGYILVYTGLGGISYNITKGIIPVPYSPLINYQHQYYNQPQYLLYQIGEGTITSNGNAYITLYSQTQAIIISAVIQGYNLISTSINPATLVPGNNNVTLHFNNLYSLMPGTQYISLTINVGGNIVNITAKAVYRP